MNILVCVKITPDPADIEFRSNMLNTDRAEWIIGSFDLQALEAGVRLAEAVPGSKVTVLTAGPARVNNSKLKKDILSRGPDELLVVADDVLVDADTALTAAVLAAAVKRIGTPVDLVLCGEGSADLYFQQVGLQLGERLGLPTLNAISKITPEGDHLVVERDLDDEIEVLEVPLPAVLSVTTGINPPRLPTMKEILKAAKKPVGEWTVADLKMDELPRGRSSILMTSPPDAVARKQVMIEGSAGEAVAKLVEYLGREGIL